MSEPTEKPSETDKKPKTKKKVKVFNKKKKQQDPENVVIEKLKAKYETIDSSAITKFSDLPLSAKTLKGLRECKYHKPTDIQKETIALALQGKDILGAAQTGSGKTLAFLVPILEHLFCKQWTRLDGLGALVLTPTRELAYQIFETLRRVGEHHDFSAGLIIGGKDLKFERNRMDQCNIMICTPGRLLQHMDENPLFDCVNMQILVLDEADRCLDMGFQQTMNSIIANLPLQRQTLLFSATQTKSVKDLARLSLKDPKYISVHEHSEFCTPKELQQSYMVCELQDKVSILWSFIKNHLKQKIIIFFSSCKQVKYMFEIFSKLRPGTSLMALYGTLHQLRRMEIYENFCKKSTAVLFATDLAARGLDFPQVHWVVQADCPEDVATYIHRVGRTARYHRGGESLLLLLKSETAMIDKMIERKIPITSTEINPTKLNNPVRKMEAFLAKDPPLKDTAQRAFVSYAKAVFLMKDKQIFNIQSLDTDSYAHSLGLAIPPRIRFLQRMNKAVLAEKIPKKPQKVEMSQNKTYFNSDDEEEAKPTAPKLVEKVEAEESEDEDEIQTTNLKPTTKQFHVSSDEGSDDEDNILQVKRRDHDVELPTDAELAEMHLGRNPKKKAVTKAAAAKKLLKKKIVPNKKIFFDDEGEVVTSGLKDKKSEMAQEYENEDDMCGIDIEKAKLILREEDKFDKQLFKEKIKAKHKEEKRKLKEQNKQKKLEENEEQDDFGEDESEGEQPDLSWMPDPDQLYGKKEDNSEDEPEFYNKSQEEEEETMKILAKPTTKEKSKKRKKPPKGVDNLETVIKRKKKQKFDEISSALSVNEAEELAMMLLNKK